MTSLPVHGPRIAAFLLAISFASATASLGMSTLFERMDMGLSFYGCARSNGAIVPESLDEQVPPICRREEMLVTWKTDDSSFHRM